MLPYIVFCELLQIHSLNYFATVYNCEPLSQLLIDPPSNISSFHRRCLSSTCLKCLYIFSMCVCTCTCVHVGKHAVPSHLASPHPIFTHSCPHRGPRILTQLFRLPVGDCPNQVLCYRTNSTRVFRMCCDVEGKLTKWRQ